MGSKRYRHRNRPAHRNRGLTLLELLLALSLTVLVLMSIAMAIDMHFRMLELRRTNVEEAVQVRSMMNHMARDLIGVIEYVPPDTSGLDVMAGNSAAAASNIATGNTGDENLGVAATGATAGGAGSGQGAGTGGGQANGAGGGQGAPGGGAAPTTPAGGGSKTGNTGGATKAGGTQTGASKTAAASGGQTGGTSGATGLAAAASSAAGSAVATANSETAASTSPASGSVIGLYGSANELKIDVSRLPRIDQYDPELATATGTAATDIPSDVKTIIYFLAGEDTPLDPNVLGPQDVLPTTTGTGRGLMRREIDRAVKSYAETNGDTDSLYYGSRLVSDKVVGLQFQYYDGSAWQTEWDSDSSGGLPKAVEIILTVQPTYGMTEQEIEDLDPDTLPPPKDYRLVVKLPTAKPASSTTTEEATDASGSTGAASGSTAATGAMP